ncbi:hypothetical protein B0H14DRAFT_2786188 [Mycena olivaceomarginata]|nr:hypothetical protein B0H14DRAFT_2786188 [Mycena olivaceomarginata]
MPGVDVLPALSTEDPLFGLIYYFIGSSVVLLLEGILISQVSNYYSWYPEDSVAMKWPSPFLFLFTLMISYSAITWINSVLYMRDPAGTVALNKEWYQVVNIPLGAVIAAYVQTYYCYRLWKLSGKWWYVAPLVTVMLVGLVSAIVTGAVIAASGNRATVAVHVSCTFATDVLITGASTFFLVRARQKALSHTRKLISNLIKICCQTALPATTATLIELISTNSIILVLLDTVPIMYACETACCTSSTTRRSLRSADASAGLGKHGSRSRTQWRSNAPVELSSLGGVHVRTQVETGETTSAVIRHKNDRVEF